MGIGSEDKKATQERIEKEFAGNNQDLLNAVVIVLRQDAFNHRDMQTIEGRAHNGMCAMAMAASTGCNTVYGSTHPSNPHPYPWMNSLFQDGPTIGWLVAESFIINHSRRSVIPERIADRFLGGFENPIGEDDYWDFTHFSDTLMTDREIAEMPKVWNVGGDGALGDIGFQNLSKAVTQNRPNLKIVMLDTQVYSNTGGQNSDSTPMLGGSDMNQFGAASQGKLIEKKGVAEAMLSGHGSPFVAQASMANAANLYKAVLDGLTYRGTAFIQCYTSCQPEHGVADSMSAKQARSVRDSRGMPEFICDPRLGETYQEALTLKGNPQPQKDWYDKPLKGNKEKYQYTDAHWAYTEARFRRHFGKVPEDFEKTMIPLEDILLRITQDDVVNRRFLDKNHRSFIPKFDVYTSVETPGGSMKPVSMSRQMVLFCVERRKNWRLLQGRAGINSGDYAAQRKLLKEFDAGNIPPEKFFGGEIQSVMAEYAKS
jgi:pyruvate-ferredoxin/flavodoxin oxidoreductase